MLLLVVLALTWLNNRSLEPDQVAAEPDNVAVPVEEVAAPAAQPPVQAAGPVVLTATDAVWVDIKDGRATLKQGQLNPGESFEVPASAAAPQLTTGKPEALKIMVGTQQAPAIGEPGRTVSKISLKAGDLMRTGAAPATAAPAQPAPQVQPAAPRPTSRATPRRTVAPRPAEKPEPNTPTSNTVAPGTGATGEPGQL